MARKGGNPDWGKNDQTYTTDRPEGRSHLMHLRIEKSLLERLKTIENWQDLTRDAIAGVVEKQGAGIPDHLKDVY